MQTNNRNECKHTNQHTTYEGVGGGGDEGVGDENVAEERTAVFPSTTACCRDQTNTKEHSHKLVNTQGECAHTYAHTPHTYSHTQHMQGIDAESEEEALGNAIRQATECCKDDTNIKQDTHKQINSQEECVCTSTNTNSTYKAKEKSV